MIQDLVNELRNVIRHYVETGHDGSHSGYECTRCPNVRRMKQLLKYFTGKTT